MRLRGVQPHNCRELRTLISPFDRLLPVGASHAWRVVTPRVWLRTVAERARDCRTAGSLRAAADGAFDLLPYQLEPALAFLRGRASRVLVADEVGLGKTIQAGILLAELAGRDESIRVLVLVPAALREQWREELRLRFGLDAVAADARWLGRLQTTLPADVNPWKLPGVHVCSLDFVKRPEVLRALEDATWDLVVIDEAHAAAAGTDRRAAAHAVACRARRVLLLTATPHAGDRDRFASLCDIGRIARHPHDDLVLFRRSRADVAGALRRRTVLLTVRPSASERRMHLLLGRYASRIRQEATRHPGRPAAPLAAIVLRKRALSSAGSLLVSVRRRLDMLAGREAPDALQLALPLGEEDPLDDDLPSAALAEPALHDAALERRLLKGIEHAAESAAGAETKVRFLLRLLRRIAEPVIVFTEYRDTLGRLASSLRAHGYDPELLHGGMTAAERVEAQSRFNASGRLLLATDAASEGLNLHHRCRIVVHFELPWSPMRLQQRAGRVDRIGQRKAVHEVLLVAGDTAERFVLLPLARRIAAARGSSVGAMRLFDSISESHVTAAVLGDRPLATVEDPVEMRACPPAQSLRREAYEEADRVTGLRRLRGNRQTSKAGPPAVRPVASTVAPRRAQCSPAVVLVYELSVRSSKGDTLHEELLVVRAVVSGPMPIRSAAAVRAAAERLAAQLGPEVRRRAGAIVSGRAERARECYEREAARLRSRSAAIAALVPAAARRLVQAGLFDRRALRSAEDRQRAQRDFSEAERDWARSLPAWSSSHVVVALTAVLIEARRGRPPRPSGR